MRRSPAHRVAPVLDCTDNQRGRSMRKTMIAQAVAMALTFSAATALAAPVVPLKKADSLLAVDANRAAVIDGIVTKWGVTLAQSGISETTLRETLEGLRADQLFAASLAYSLSGFYETLEGALLSFDSVKTKDQLESRSLGATS